MKKSLLLTYLILLTILIFSFSSTALAENNKLTNDACLFCHAGKDLQVSRSGQNLSLFIDQKEFEESIHATNNCTTCHDQITEIPHKNTIYGDELRMKVNDRCLYCHQDVAAEYTKGVHSQIKTKDSASRPNAFCSDCHGNHRILKKENPESIANRTKISAECAKCHEHQKEAYYESFHGKANYLGSKISASCADCHGSHQIQGPNEASSTVSKTNTPKTCAKCHVVARENFAVGLEHWTLTNTPGSSPMYYTFKFFIWLTIGIIALLVIHMEMELYRLYQNVKKG